MRPLSPVLSVVLAFCLLLSLAACRQASVGSAAQQIPEGGSAETMMSCTPVDRVDVVHFHATQQCVSCIAVGRLAKATLEESFAEEMRSGHIVFRDINGELPENRDIVIQYQARGSSLFVNAVSQGQDHIEEDVTVWRLYSNAAQYKQYFERKIRTLLSCAS